ncbi:MAG: mechanosensitive ion channel [Psychrosphaera sp.]|nr:mechanosensitive ion channel [Psychrosphaera sp.]
MIELLSLFKNPYVFAYVVLIILAQMGYLRHRSNKEAKIAANRADAGLPPQTIVTQSVKLEELKIQAHKETWVLILPLVLLPFLLAGLEFVVNACWFNEEAGCSTTKASIHSGDGLLFTFFIFLLWLMFTGTELAKAAIGGITFRTVMVLGNTLQVGDRVTIDGNSGKLIDIGVFYLTLVTLDDDKICLPTNSLWGSALTSSNDGDRSSLVCIPFYLSSTNSAKKLQDAEDALWDAIQASNYFEPTKNKQIYYQQEPSYIQLTAKAYVASTYNEPLFRSDITRRFLHFAKKNDILLANQSHTVNLIQTVDGQSQESSTKIVG